MDPGIDGPPATPGAAAYLPAAKLTSEALTPANVLRTRTNPGGSRGWIGLATISVAARKSVPGLWTTTARLDAGAAARAHAARAAAEEGEEEDEEPGAGGGAAAAAAAGEAGDRENLEPASTRNPRGALASSSAPLTWTISAVPTAASLSSPRATAASATASGVRSRESLCPLPTPGSSPASATPATRAVSTCSGHSAVSLAPVSLRIPGAAERTKWTRPPFAAA